MNKNAYIQLNLKKASRVTYANNSKRLGVNTKQF